MKRNRSVKIVATIGPSSSDPEKLEKLFLAGVDVFRLNFSHGSHDGHREVYEAIRAIEKKHHHNSTILADLQGPKLRIGTFENGKIILERGDIFRFDLNLTSGDTRRVALPHPEVLEALKVGTILLLDDGKLRFEVIRRGSEYVEANVLVGGPLSNRKGVNVPHAMLKIPALTEKDRKDLDFALDLGVDWIALSFVQSVEDVEEVKDIIGNRAQVMAKLEKPLAIKALEPIVEISDGIMIARGDLGVEMDPEDVPVIQRKILNTCHRIGRPVIVATQMLESMITSPSPTRAEVSDVATAVYSGTDATMLSAETASGQYPLEAVSIMSRVITKVETDPCCIKKLEENTQLPQQSVLDALCLATKNAAEFSCANAIVLCTDSFEDVVRCSRLRPRVPVVLLTESKQTARQAGLCNGVVSVVARKEFCEKLVATAQKIVEEQGLATVGDKIVVMSVTETFIKICQL
ncbi:MAG: pyruvate kinase [Holosporaceae bacterium]|jgi:pyruvate kinase|nr:pyruvate kinase [Holosporaceae bacterium]